MLSKFFNRLWYIAFGERPSWRKPFSLAIWALFGNNNKGDNGGPYGWLPRDKTKPDPNWSATFKWWLRNPFHNLTHYLLAVPFKKQTILLGKVDKSPAFWPSGKVLVAFNGLPFFAFRFKKVEGYIGFRPKVVDDRQVGVFGMAFRGRRQ